jgi:1,2-phenylacetyl-CoA epoxidase PaaB subunit
MNKIISPLKSGMKGTSVADLQDALQLFLDRSAILANDASGRQQLSLQLKRDRAAGIYSDTTAKLVSTFQTVGDRWGQTRLIEASSENRPG